MNINTSLIVIVLVIAFAFFLIYTHNSQPKFYPQQQVPGNQGIAGAPNTQIPHPNRPPNIPEANLSPFQQGLDNNTSCPHCHAGLRSEYGHNHSHGHSHTHTHTETQPQNLTTRIMIENESDPYADPIKKQDLYAMYDPLTYPQMRLPREVLEKYNEYYERNGTHPPFNQQTQPLYDNPMLNGYLTKYVSDEEPFRDNVPAIIPLFRIKSSKNTNRFFYYILDQRHNSKFELKIPLDNIRLNGIRHQNADFYGVPEIYDGDILENIPSYPGSKFRVTLYKTYHFP